MSIAGIFFSFWRCLEILTLIPTLGMLAYFVNIYQHQGLITPASILTLFIVSVLAAVWAIVTLLRRKSRDRSAPFVSFIDLCFVGALIAGVYELRFISKESCTTFGNNGSGLSLTVSTNGVSGSNPFSLNTNKTCAMLKASFAFGIMNIIFFAITSFLLLFMHRNKDEIVYEKRTTHRRSHDSRRGHSRSGGSHHRRSGSSRRYDNRYDNRGYV